MTKLRLNSILNNFHIKLIAVVIAFALMAGPAVADDEIIIARSKTAIEVDRIGAAGNGVTDDSDAILSAITTGKHLVFTFGKTYLVSKKLTLSAGQGIVGNGATIKRADQVITTTTTATTGGVTTSITVADASGFRAGQQVGFKNGVLMPATNYTISTIAGNVITLASPIAESFTGTTYVFSSFMLLEVVGGKVTNLTIDGNKSNHTYYQWTNTVEILSRGGSNHIEGCYIHDYPGEAIMESAVLPWNYLPVSEKNFYIKNRIVSGNGNGIHLSASISPLIDGNYIKDTNLDSAVVGHDGGAVAFSGQIRGAKIINNTMINNRCGVGTANAYNATHTLIANNEIRNSTTFAIEARSGTLNSPNTDLTISGNKIFDSVSVVVGTAWVATDPADPTGDTTNGSPTITGLSSVSDISTGMAISGTGIPADSIIIGFDTDNNTITIGDKAKNPVNATADGNDVTLAISGTYPERIQLINNELFNTSIVLARVNGMTISGNLIGYAPGKKATASSQGIYFNYFCTNVGITNNTFVNCYESIMASTTANANVLIAGNVSAGGSRWGFGFLAASTNVVIVNNVITCNSDANTDFTGIQVEGPVVIKNNSVIQAKGYATIRIQGGAGTIIQGNTDSNGAYNGSSRFGILIDAGSSAYFISNNTSNDAIVDTPTAGTLRDNDTY